MVVLIVIFVRHYAQYFTQVILFNRYKGIYVRHYSYPHLTDGEIEAPGGYVTCIKSLSPGFKVKCR